MKRVIAACVMSLFCQLPGFCSDRNQAIVVSLRHIMDAPSTISLRGGDKKKALGCYAPAKEVVFRSGYEKLPAETIAEWTKDLHDFIVSRGGGYMNFQKYEVENGLAGRNQDVASHFSKKPDPFDSYERATVPYSEQIKFAEQWWKDRDEGYETAMMKSWWLNDAVLDGNNLWLRYEAHVIRGADATAWRDSQLNELVKTN